MAEVEDGNPSKSSLSKAKVPASRSSVLALSRLKATTNWKNLFAICD